MFSRKLTAFLLAAIISLVLVPFAALAENSDVSEVIEDTSKTEESVPETSTPEGSTPAEDLTVTVSCGTGGDYTLESTEGSRPSKNEYYYVTGDIAVLTVTSNDGYLVDTVTVDGKEVRPAGGVYTFTVTANHAVVITFKQVATYTITVDCVDTDGAPVDGVYFKVNGEKYEGTARLEENTDFTIEFFAKPAYAVKQTRYFTGTRYMDIDNPHEDKLVENIGYLVVVEAQETYGATVTVGENGSVLLNGVSVSGETVVPQGVNSTLTFVPDEGYEVDEVLVNEEAVEITDNQYTFTPEGDVTVSVTFKEKVDYCKITLSVGNGGSITVKDEAYEIENKKYIYVPVGESITLVFEPHVNYELNTVKVSGKTVKLNEDNEYTIECTDTAATVSATFRSTEETEEVFYTVTAFVSGGGTITPAGANEIEEGGDITFTITANEGYEIYSVTVDGEDVTLTGGKYTIKNVSANMVISATFKKATVNDAPITVEDIDWTAETIVIDVTEKSNVSTEIFQRAASNYPEKKILINDSEFSLVIPGGGAFNPDGDTVSFDFMRNGSPNFVAIQDAVSTEYPSAAFVTVYCTSPALPAGTVLEIYLGNEFSGADLSPVEFLSGALNSIGDTLTADEKGWATVNYSNQKDLVFVEVSEDKATLTVTYNTECGTVDPSGTIKVALGETKTITVTPNEGYVVGKITLDGEEIDITEDGVYTVTMDKDHTFTVVFEAPSSVNVGLIIALVIIALAVVGGAAVFVLRWRKNQF